MVEPDLAFLETDEDIAAAMRRVLECLFYGFEAAGGVEDDGGHIAAGDVLQLAGRVVGGVDGMDHFHLLTAELEPSLVDVHDDGFGALQAGRFQDTQADGAGADDEYEFSRLDRCAPDGMGAYGEG